MWECVDHQKRKKEKRKRRTAKITLDVKRRGKEKEEEREKWRALREVQENKVTGTGASKKGEEK